MAEAVYGAAHYDETRPEATFLGSVLKRTSWGAVFAGAVTAITVQMVLTVLGVAIGVTASELTREPSLYVNDGIKIGTAIWWLMTGAISLFAGGCVVGRFAGITRSPDVLLHAFVMWGITALFGLVAVTSGAGALYGTAMNSSYAGAQAYHEKPDARTGTEQNLATGAQSDPLSTVDVQEAQRFLRTASWWTLFGLVVGIGASLAGCWLATPERIVLTSPSHGSPNNPVVKTRPQL